MKRRGLYGQARKGAAWVKMGLLAGLFCIILGFLICPPEAGKFCIGVSPSYAADRKTKTVTFEASGTITAGTQYSSGFLIENYTEGVILLNVSAKSGTPTFSLVLETSDDDSTYYYHSTIDGEVTETGTTAYPVTDLGKYVRTKETLSGVTNMTVQIKGVFKN